MTSSLTFKQGTDSGKGVHRPETSVLANDHLQEDQRNAAAYHHDQIWDYKCSWSQRMEGDRWERMMCGGLCLGPDLAETRCVGRFLFCYGPPAGLG